MGAQGFHVTLLGETRHFTSLGAVMKHVKGLYEPVVSEEKALARKVFELGTWLHECRENLVPYGQWLETLTQWGINHRTAVRYIKIARTLDPDEIAVLPHDTSVRTLDRLVAERSEVTRSESEKDAPRAAHLAEQHPDNFGRARPKCDDDSNRVPSIRDRLDAHRRRNSSSSPSSRTRTPDGVGTTSTISSPRTGESPEPMSSGNGRHGFPAQRPASGRPVRPPAPVARGASGLQMELPFTIQVRDARMHLDHILDLAERGELDEGQVGTLTPLLRELSRVSDEILDGPVHGST